MKLKDFACYFIKTDDHKVLLLCYYKTNIMPKEVPAERRPPNRVYGVVFDKGIDYVMSEPITYNKFKVWFESLPGDKYDLADYKAASMYELMKELGAGKYYTKKWVEGQYNFINKQRAIIDLPPIPV